jgi:hypothetical protein
MEVQASREGSARVANGHASRRHPSTRLSAAMWRCKRRIIELRSATCSLETPALLPLGGILRSIPGLASAPEKCGSAAERRYRAHRTPLSRTGTGPRTTNTLTAWTSLDGVVSQVDHTTSTTKMPLSAAVISEWCGTLPRAHDSWSECTRYSLRSINGFGLTLYTPLKGLSVSVMTRFARKRMTATSRKQHMPATQ